MIKEIMTSDHRNCDEPLGMIEELISQQKYDKALPLFLEWKKKNLRHFEVEETFLFPETETRMGQKIPPIFVMLNEHAQIRSTIELMELALDKKDKTSFLGHSDTCMIMIQQHNMKEEQILYPIIDQVLNEANFSETLKGKMS